VVKGLANSLCRLRQKADRRQSKFARLSGKYKKHRKQAVKALVFIFWKRSLSAPAADRHSLSHQNPSANSGTELLALRDVPKNKNLALFVVACACLPADRPKGSKVNSFAWGIKIKNKDNIKCGLW